MDSIHQKEEKVKEAPQRRPHSSVLSASNCHASHSPAVLIAPRAVGPEGKPAGASTDAPARRGWMYKLYGFLSSHADKDGWVHGVGMNEIAQAMGVTRAQIVRYFKYLERMENPPIVVVHRRGSHRCNSYYLQKGGEIIGDMRACNMTETTTLKAKAADRSPSCPPLPLRILTPNKEYKKQSKDRGRSHGISSKKWTNDYPGGSRVVLVLGARLYRQVMQALRLGLESWQIPQSVSDALEGWFGLRIDGATLEHARFLKDRLWLLKSDIERMAASGAPARTIVQFVAGRVLSPSRAEREVSNRTARLERRIAGLKRWLADRVREYQEGRICSKCGYRHSASEYQSGRRDGTYDLVCFGYARIYLDELATERTRAQHESERMRCTLCGRALSAREGYIENPVMMCWTCFSRTKKGDECPDGNGTHVLYSPLTPIYNVLAMLGIERSDHDEATESAVHHRGVRGRRASRCDTVRSGRESPAELSRESSPLGAISKLVDQAVAGFRP